MTSDFPNRDEFETLLERFCHGEFSDDEFARLEDFVSEHQTARERYIHELDLIAQLEWGESLAPKLDPPASELVEPARRRFRATQHKLGISISVAVAVVVSGLLTMHFMKIGPFVAEKQQEQDLAEQPSAPEKVAKLTNWFADEWVGDSRPPLRNPQLAVGQRLLLSAGLAEITYDTGARVVIEGPAEYEVVGKNSGYLSRGKVTARIESNRKKAYGFSIDTPAMLVEDLGTEFGVEVSADRVTSLHVFEGKVVCKTDDEGELGRRTILAGNGLRLAPGEFPANGETLSADRGGFETSIAAAVARPRAGDVPVTDQLALWLDAGQAVRKDDRGRVSAWGDIVRVPYTRENVARQRNADERPLWVESAIGGKPAVRFDGMKTRMLVDPLTTTDDHTAIVLFQQRSGTRKKSPMGIVLHYNGPPSEPAGMRDGRGIIHLWFKGSQTSFAGSVFAADTVGLVTASELIGALRPTIAVYRYNHSKNIAELFRNGEKQGQATAAVPIAYTQTISIGKHGGGTSGAFRGDIAEVLLFNKALTDEERTKVEEYLGKKYGVLTDN